MKLYPTRFFMELKWLENCYQQQSCSRRGVLFPLTQKVTLFDSSDHLLNQQQQCLDKTFSSDKKLKSFIQSPLLHLSFLFENAKRTSCLTKTSLPQIMLNECWQAKSDAANISRSVFEWSPISQDISKYLIFVIDFLSMSLYICSVFMDLCWLIGGSLFQWNSQYLAPRGERNPSFPLWGPEVNFLSVICNNNNLYFVLLKISLISGK